MANEVHNSSISISRLYSNQYQKSGYKFLQNKLIKFQRGGFGLSVTAHQLVYACTTRVVRAHISCYASSQQLLCGLRS